MLLAVPMLAAEDESRGLILYERFLGSSNTLGNFLRLDTTVGYSFNKYFSIDGGLPVFFVRPSETTTASAVAKSNNGIGNAYLDLRFALANPLVNYSLLALTAAIMLWAGRDIYRGAWKAELLRGVPKRRLHRRLGTSLDRRKSAFGCKAAVMCSF